jgi:hypothetical protein
VFLGIGAAVFVVDMLHGRGVPEPGQERAQDLADDHV